VIHIVAMAGAVLWIAANFYLWSMKQSDEALFLESLGMAMLFYPAFDLYMRRE
jgi:hypothetical protein